MREKLSTYSAIFAPLLSIFILMNGLGLLSTFMPLHLSSDGVSPTGIGIVTACYYLGMALGAFQNAALILRVGHIRAFAAFAALITAAVLLNGIFDSIWSWAFFRAITGYCLAGLYIVIESWILKESTLEVRGKFLSLYMIAIYGATALGQFWLNFGLDNPLFPFMLISALTALSILPLAITKIGTPTIEEPSALSVVELFKLTPSGLIACTAAGLLFGSITGFVPLYIQGTLAQVSDTAFVMFLLLLGGVLLQYPVGRLSDLFDRRKVLVALCALIVTISVLVLLFSGQSKMFLYVFMFIFGGVSFSLYPVSISHTCDVLEPNDIIAATQGLMLAYGIGAVLGPLILPFFMNLFSYSGIFVYFIVVCSMLGIYLSSRIVVSSPTLPAEHQDFVPMFSTTPVAAELDPRAEEEL